MNIRLVLILCLLTLLSCSESNNTIDGPNLIPSGLDLMGLTNGRTFVYSQIDSSETWTPNYQVTEDTSTLTINIEGSSDDWIIYNDSIKMLNLKVTEPYIALNGYWIKVNDSDALSYFPIPAIIMDLTAKEGSSWSGYTPQFSDNIENESLQFLYGYFGFHFTKTYTGKEQVLVPAFVGDAYTFEALLYENEGDEESVATVTEYYANKIGLVKLEMHANGFIRVLTLRTFD